MRILIVLLVKSVFLSSIFAADTSELEPSDDETVMLDLINRFRANPAREIDRILLGVEAGISGMGQNLDVDACYQAVAALPPVKPLVFNLRLMGSARNHAYYQIVNNMTGHYQEEGRKLFTGKTPRERVTRMGYKGYRLSENAFRNAVSVWNSHRGFIIDWGPGPGGMQDPPGHRLVLANPLHREIGCAFVPFDEGRHGSTVHNVGDDKKTGRLIGGIVYLDKNRNDRYDPGEGLADLPLQCGNVVKETWRSGAFRVVLPHENAAVLQIRHGDKTYNKQLKAGPDNLYLQCILPQEGDAIYMFKQMQTFKLHLNDMTRAVAINTYIRTRGYFRDDVQEALINKHCAAVAEEWYLDKSVLLPIYYTAKNGPFQRFLTETRAKWLGTDADKFFKDAATAFPVYVETKTLVDAIRARQPIQKGSLEHCVALLQKTQQQLTSEEIIHSLHVLEIMLTRSVSK